MCCPCGGPCVWVSFNRPSPCVGVTGSLIGASANVVLAGVSAKNGYPITFMSYLKKGFPLMLLSVAICTVYLLIRFA